MEEVAGVVGKAGRRRKQIKAGVLWQQAIAIRAHFTMLYLAQV